MHADEAQIYLALSPNDYSPIDFLCRCIDEITVGVTEVIAFGNKDEMLKVNA